MPLVGHCVFHLRYSIDEANVDGFANDAVSDIDFFNGFNVAYIGDIFVI